MHENTKQRILEKETITDNRPKLSLPKTGNIYDNFVGGVDKLCEDTMLSDELTDEQKGKIAFLRSKIKIEM